MLVYFCFSTASSLQIKLCNYITDTAGLYRLLNTKRVFVNLLYYFFIYSFINESLISSNLIVLYCIEYSAVNTALMEYVSWYPTSIMIQDSKWSKRVQCCQYGSHGVCIMVPALYNDTRLKVVKTSTVLSIRLSWSMYHGTRPL